MDFKQLREMYSTWSATRWKRYQAAVMFTRHFNDGFIKHLDAPSKFRDLDGEEKHYIELVKVKPLDDELKYTLDESGDSWSKFDGHISEEEEDGLVFGISVVVDAAENSWPKEMINFFRLSFRPRLEGTTLYVFRDPFEISLADAASWNPVYTHMTNILVRTLTTFEPSDEPTPYLIGFTARAPSA